uniref:Uncharacterized protein n=1 Tax=Rhizophora mucronata TaxID=61149 RepID=A0A2P2NXT4_RHIMU
MTLVALSQSSLVKWSLL